MLTQITSFLGWRVLDTKFQGLILPIFALGLMIGTALYMATSINALWVGMISASGVVFAWAGASISTARFYRFQAMCALCCGVFLGVILVVLKAHMVAAPRIEAPSYPVYVEGWVSGIDYGDKGPRVRIMVHAIAGLTKEQTPKYVRLTHISNLEMAPGRFVRCWSVLRPPPRPSIPGDFDFRRKAWFEQLGGVGYVRGKCRGGVLGAPTGVLNAARNKLAAMRFALSRYVAARSYPAMKGLSAALVTGDRSGLSPTHVEDLRTVGLSHLLAISGLHLGLVCGLAFGLFRGICALIPWVSDRLPSPYAGACGALVCGTIYLLLSGGSVSTQRAYIMSVVFFGAMLIDRNALSMRGFFVALILVLLLQPQSIVGAGFQMSFAATGALILVYSSWNRYRYENGYSGRGNWVRFFFQSLLVTSVVAGLATLPFSYYHFGRTAPLTLFANVIVMPIVSLVTAPSAALAAITAPIDGGQLGLTLYSWSLHWIVEISGFIARLSRQWFGDGPSAPVNMPMLSALLFFAAIICALFDFSRRYWIASVVLICVALGVWAIVPKPAVYLARNGVIYWQNTQDKWVSAPVYERDALSPMKLKGFVSPLPACEVTACDIAAKRQDRWPANEELFAKGSVLYQRFGTWHYTSSPCGHRPWASCETPAP